MVLGMSDDKAVSKLLPPTGDADSSSRRPISHDAHDKTLVFDGVTRGDFNTEEKDEPTNESPFDQGYYGWVVCTACCAGQFLLSFGLSYGLFNIVLLEHFQRSTAETALVGSVCYGFTCGMGVLSGMLANRLGHRLTCMIGSLLTTLGFIISAFSPNLTVLYLSYGVMVGTGVSMMAVTTSVMVNFYFSKYRNLAIGITTSGAGMGGLVLPLVIEYFIEVLSWRGALIVLAGISLQGCVIGALLKPNERLRIKRTEITKHKSKLTFHVTLFKKWTFFLFVLVFFMAGVCFSIFFNILPHRMVKYGFTTEQAALMLFLIGAASTTARILNGVFFHFHRLDTSIAFGVAFTGMALVYVVLAFQHRQLWVITLVSIGYGLVYGTFAYTHPLQIVSLFGVERINSAYGFVSLGEGLGGLLGSPIAGFIYDRTSDYQVAFIVASILSLAAGVANIPMYWYLRQKRRRDIIID